MFKKTPTFKTFAWWMKAHIAKSKIIIPALREMPPVDRMPEWCKELPLDERTMECGVIKWIAQNPKILRWVRWWLTYPRLIKSDETKTKWVFNENWESDWEDALAIMSAARSEANRKRKGKTGKRTKGRSYNPRIILELKPKNPKTVAEWQQHVCAQTTMSQRTFYLLKKKLPPKQQALDYQLPEEPPRYETLNPKPEINIPELMKQINHEHSSPTH